MSGILRRLLYLLFALECLYLLAGNLLANTDFLQQQISRNAEKFTVGWGAALTPLPGIYWVSDLSLRVQTPRTQAWLEAGSTLGQISMLRLLRREFHTSWLRVRDLKVYLRPRPRAGRPLQGQYPYFPPIKEARLGDQDEIVDEAAWYAEKKPQWLIDLDNLRIDNLVEAWLWNYRFSAVGNAAASMSYKTRDQLRVEEATATLQIDGVRFNDQTVTGQLAVDAGFAIDPYLPREMRGSDMLRFVSGKFVVAGNVSSLGFIDYYLAKVPWLKLNGSGDLAATLMLDRGRMQVGSNLEVTNAATNAQVKQYRIEGTSAIRGTVTQTTPSALPRAELGVEFASVQVRYGERRVPLVQGSDMRLNLQSRAPLIGEPIDDPQLALNLEAANIPDMAELNRLIPDTLELALEAGAGSISGNIALHGAGGTAALRIDGEIERARLGRHLFRTGFESNLELDIVESGAYRIDGSRIRLFDARNEQGAAESPSWSAALEIELGSLEPWEAEAREPLETGSDRLNSALRLASGELRIKGEVSDIGFLNPMLSKIEKLGVGGGAELRGRFLIDAGEPVAGSTLRFESERLLVDYLDYTAQGAGILVGELTEVAHDRWLTFRGGLREVAIRQSGDQDALLQGGELRLRASGHGESFIQQMEELTAEIEIPTVPIHDLTVYNSYLPPNTGIRLIGGNGELSASFLFQDERVSGQVNLAAAEVEVDVKGRPIVGGLNLHVPLKNGSPGEMVFDIDMATLRLNELRMLDAVSIASPWSGRAYVRRGRTKWKRPLALDAEVRLEMDDSAPLVYLFVPGKSRERWIGEILTIPNIRGYARVAADDRSLVMNNVTVSGDDLDVRAQLRFRNQEADGMLYARLHKLAAAVELRHGEPDWKLIKAKEKYEAYPPFPVRMPVLEANLKKQPDPEADRAW